MDRPVLDMTQIVGVFSFHTTFSMGRANGNGDAAPASTSGERGGGVPASPGALGIGTFPDLDRPRLKLESKKASVEFLVVDRAEGPDGKLSTTAQCRRAASDMGGYRDKGSSDVTREPAGPPPHHATLPLPSRPAAG